MWFASLQKIRAISSMFFWVAAGGTKPRSDLAILDTDNTVVELYISTWKNRTRTENIAPRYYISPWVAELLEGWVFVVFQSRKHDFNLAIVSTINAMRYDPCCRQTQIKKLYKGFTS